MLFILTCFGHVFSAGQFLIHLSAISLSRQRHDILDFAYSLGSRVLHVTLINNTHEKLLDSDWLRAVQFKCNTSAKSVTPVQKV